MDWKNLSWPALAALVCLLLMGVTLVLPNVPDVVVIALGFTSVTGAVLSLRSK
jgi:hypothetical protein